MLYKKAISPVVATALLLVVAVVAVVSFQGWFNTYSSSTFSDVEGKSSNDLSNSGIDSVIGNTLYFKNGESDNITVTTIKIGNVNCNLTPELSPGMNVIDISNCTSNLSSAINDVVIITNKDVIEKSVYIKDVKKTSLVSNPVDYGQVVLDDGPIGYWRLDETSGTTLVDSSTYSNNGTFQNSPTLNSVGLGSGTGTGVNFDGTNDYANVPHIAAYNTDEMTLEAWIRLETYDTKNAIFHHGDTSVGSNQGVNFYVSSANNLVLSTFVTGPGWTGATSAGSNISLNSIYHVAMTHDPGLDEVSFYVNGSLIETKSYTNGLPTTAYSIKIGNIKEVAYTSYFDGTLDEVAYYNRALTPAEILEHYNAGK